MDSDEIAPASTLDLALDVLPCRGRASFTKKSANSCERLTGRSAARSEQRETAGWELTQDLVYER